jgi:hypothetical protein
VTHGDGGRLAGLPGLQERVEVSTDTGGTQPEAGSDFRRGDRPLLEEELYDGSAGVAFVADGDG